MDTPGTTGQGGSMSVINDDDPCLLHEIQHAESNSSKQRQRKETDQHMCLFSQDLMQEMFNTILKECAMYIPIQSTRKFKGESFEFGTFEVQIIQESFTPPVPSLLPECTEYWLYIHKNHGQDLEEKSYNMLYFETSEADENEPKEKCQRIFWCVKLDLPVQVCNVKECWIAKMGL
jgi:hypothetical protein